MNVKNAEKFRETFGIYASELWSMTEKDFTEWLNNDTGETDARKAPLPDGTLFVPVWKGLEVERVLVWEKDAKAGQWFEKADAGKGNG